MTEHQVQFTSRSPDTVLEPLARAEADALAAASALPPEPRRTAVLRRLRPRSSLSPGLGRAGRAGERPGRSVRLRQGGLPPRPRRLARRQLARLGLLRWRDESNAGSASLTRCAKRRLPSGRPTRRNDASCSCASSTPSGPRAAVEAAVEVVTATTGFGERYGDWAVVAGASEGVGRPSRRTMAERGVNVVLISRSRIAARPGCGGHPRSMAGRHPHLGGRPGGREERGRREARHVGSGTVACSSIAPAPIPTSCRSWTRPSQPPRPWCNATASFPCSCAITSPRTWSSVGTGGSSWSPREPLWSGLAGWWPTAPRRPSIWSWVKPCGPSSTKREWTCSRWCSASPTRRRCAGCWPSGGTCPAPTTARRFRGPRRRTKSPPRRWPTWRAVRRTSSARCCGKGQRRLPGVTNGDAARVMLESGAGVMDQKLS